MQSLTRSSDKQPRTPESLKTSAALGASVLVGSLVTIAMTLAVGVDLPTKFCRADQLTTAPNARAPQPISVDPCGATRDVEATDEVTFSGYDWIVRRSGTGGPGPNRWDEKHAWVDDRGALHLKLAERDGTWYCSELYTRKSLGFGRYQFWIVGRLDELDPNVVFGLFNYPTRDVGTDGTHEIDIEFARWGRTSAPVGNYTVWPTRKGLKQISNSFAFTLDGDQSTHRFTWNSTSISFQSLDGHVDDDQNQFSSWQFKPSEPTTAISQTAMPLHINLWCFKGRPPTDGKSVELVVSSFKFTPE